MAKSTAMKILVGAHSLNFIPDRHHHRVGNLFSPGGYWNHKLQFSLDNYVFTCWKNGWEWSESRFLAHLDKVKCQGKAPQWVVCPDAVGDSKKSLQLWSKYADRLRSDYHWPLAFAVQDGQLAKDVPTDADVIFVGGSTAWKYATIDQWCAKFPRVHVARINTYRWLWHCHKSGAESIDGTGWFWKNKREHQDLLDYLAITEGLSRQESGALFPIHEYSNPIANLTDRPSIEL